MLTKKNTHIHAPLVRALVSGNGFRERRTGRQVKVHVHERAEHLPRPPAQLRHVVHLARGRERPNTRVSLLTVSVDSPVAVVVDRLVDRLVYNPVMLSLKLFL